MPITYNLAPVPRWFFTDDFGKPLSGGSLKSFRDTNRSQFKPIYQDINGLFPYTDPIPFDANGMAPGIFYFASDEYYYLEIYDGSVPTPVLQFTVTGYNAPGFGMPVPPVPADQFPDNLVRNAQFSLWSSSASWPTYGTATNQYDYVSDDWSFNRSNTNATINITRQTFALGQTDVPNSPVYFLDYECTNAGAGGATFQRFQQYYKSVQTLAGQTATLSFWAKTRSTGALTFDVQQFFGTGGAPSSSVITQIISIPVLSTNWTFYSSTFTLPSVAGKTLGTNGDDALILELNTPLNQPATVNCVNVYLETGAILSPFPYITIDKQAQGTDYNVTQSLWYTGDIKTTLRAVADPGWLMMDDGTIGNSSSGSTHVGFFTKALFELIWNNVSNTYAPIFNSDGSAGTRGANAEADYNANKRMSLTKALGRVMAAATIGPPAHPLGQFVGEETHTLTIAELASHAHPVSLFTSNLAHFTAGADFPITNAVQTTSNTGGDEPHNNLQPTVYVNFMIKL
jgi:hypothetical protein